MDFQLSAEDAAFQDEVRTWLADHREEIAHTREVDWEAGGEAFERYRAWERTLFDAGLGAVAWPKEYGGRGARAVHDGAFTHPKVPGPEPDPGQRPRLRLFAATP